jgi:hypothetical protein
MVLVLVRAAVIARCGGARRQILKSMKQARKAFFSEEKKQKTFKH